MKVLSAEQIREADRYTINNEPVSSVELMERASSLCTKWLLQQYSDNQTFRVFCGNGNNGGDGLCIARLLLNNGRKAIVVLVGNAAPSADYAVQLELLRTTDNAEVVSYSAGNNFEFREHEIVIDAIFGSGLNRKPADDFAGAIAAINSSEAEVVAIDIPSGLYADFNDDQSTDCIVKADYTLTFHAPKFTFLVSDFSEYVGEFVVLDIGLLKSFTENMKSYAEYFTIEEAGAILHHRSKFSHKGTYGHALIAGGSEGKTGAAILCTRAALRTGAGLVTAYVPLISRDVMQAAVPEAMVITGEEEKFIAGRIPAVRFDAVGIGPGAGTADSVVTSLKNLLNEYKGPMVWDADALNILSENRTWLDFLPPLTILTPHPGEFDRLTEKHTSGVERLKTQRRFAQRYNVIVVLKGAHTSVAFPDGSVTFNSSGNPGMATGGSGDVLTGIITALLAQGYNRSQSAMLGVYIHGLAGDIAASVNGQEGMIAGDIADQIGGAMRMIGDKIRIP
jgi:ADP-dependent NAD(P)H-hydrate dehydratase / NAD(P)H-hydrate epimerase